MNEQPTVDHGIHLAINKLFTVLTDNIIFIYTPPKVGSTTLVTSLRVSLGKSYNVIHLHDETMLKVLTGINDVTINDMIHYLANQGKNVFVIDVYRTPVERKMSEFFEKISPYHFNNSESNISQYSIDRIIHRFNKVFPHIENGDNTFDKYKIDDPVPFDFNNKYTVQIINNIKYIKLRLCDSDLWASMLSTILNSDIVIIPDYQTADKGIGELYTKFKNEYKLPSNYLERIKDDKYFNFYYSEMERKSYLMEWAQKSAVNEFSPYTEPEYDFYIMLCLENQYINDIQGGEHYIDGGCFCKNCSFKRREMFIRAKAGEKQFEKMNHSEIFNQYQAKEIKKELNKTPNKFPVNKFKIKFNDV